MKIIIGNQTESSNATEDPLPDALASMASVIANANKKAQLERDEVMNKIASGLNHAVDPSQILARW